MTRPGSLALALAAAVSTAVAAARIEQAPDASTAATVERAGRYVEAYERDFAAIVSEERQVQRIVRADGRVKQTRELRADFLLIKTGPSWAQVFRDVIEVDGRPIRDREDRLRKLFLEKPRNALQQAQAIANESRRHNIGLARQGNSPLLPLLFLHPQLAARSRFTLSGGSLRFEEVQRPTLLARRRDAEARIDIVSTGSFNVDAESGRVLAAELTGLGPPDSYSVALAVQFGEDEQLQLMVPVSVRERYWHQDKPKDDVLEVEASYSNFRRFQVTTAEQVKPPPD